MFELRDEQVLPGRDRRAREMVRLLQLPDAGARVSPVPSGRNRPERLARSHGVVLRRSARAGVAGQHGPDEHGDEDDDEDTTEHVFAL